MKLLTYSVNNNPLRLGILFNEETILDPQQAYIEKLLSVGQERAEEIAKALLPSDPVSFLANGEIAMSAAKEAIDYASNVQSTASLYLKKEVYIGAPIVRPGKIICVGLNYRDHINEMKREFPAFPVIFAKFSNAIIGPEDPIPLNEHLTKKLDYEGEMAFVIGKKAKNISQKDAMDYVAGYSVVNDITARDMQKRTIQWLQGKTLDASLPMGPYLVTKDGEGAFGRVDGEKIKFEPGDFLITPTWSWHDHTNEGDETVFWMDCLDTPFIMAMNVSFTEFHPDKQQPLLVPDDYSSRRYQGGMVRPLSDRTPKSVALGRYKWGLTKQSLDGLAEFEPDPIEGFAIEYINPSNGKDANDRIGARMQKLPPSFTGKAHRLVHSNVYHVHKGKGYTVMNGVRFHWSEGDFFVIPAWTWHEHVNTSAAEDAFLFSTNDLPIMEAFHFERVEEYTQNGGHQEIIDIFQPILP